MRIHQRKMKAFLTCFAMLRWLHIFRLHFLSFRSSSQQQIFSCFFPPPFLLENVLSATLKVSAISSDELAREKKTFLSCFSPLYQPLTISSFFSPLDICFLWSSALVLSADSISSFLSKQPFFRSGRGTELDRECPSHQRLALH